MDKIKYVRVSSTRQNLDIPLENVGALEKVAPFLLDELIVHC
ncbi:hypothetical protein [Vibrio parahaemolyticus]|nr:hypothetical protein [Vibrio parahaemolyticus]